MKTIKIFLASSEELMPEREKMTDLVLHLNKLFKGRGLELDLEKWEYFDSSMSTNSEKQDDYNEILKECEMCLVIFWRRFGRFTAKEFDIARQQMIEGKNPKKIYVFFKNLEKEDDITPELKSFKESVYSHYGHFYCKFANVDTIKLEFLLQLELYQKGLLGEKTIEVRDEHVYVDNEVVADLNNIPFAANNDGYKKMQAELKELNEEIVTLQAELDKKQQKLERKKTKMEKEPDDVDYQEEYQEAKEEVENMVEKLQKILDRKNKIEEAFEHEQQNLINTARRITELRGQKISERMSRAIEAFENGEAHRADIILDESEHDADEALNDILVAKRVGLQSLEELILKAFIKMANDTIPIEERVDETRSIYEKADNLAQEVGFDKKEYAKLLRDHADFLKKRDPMKAMDLFVRQSQLLQDVYGVDSIYVARVYDDIAKILTERWGEENWGKAKTYLEKAIKIKVKYLGEKDQDTAKSYRLMGELQHSQLLYTETENYLKKAADIYIETIGKEKEETARCLRSLGMLYKKQFEERRDRNFYEIALDYFSQAIDILEKVVGEENEQTLIAYNNIANLYRVGGDYDHSLEFHRKSLDSKERALGFYHLSTAIEYNNLGVVYHDKALYDDALSCCFKSLKIKKKLLNDNDYSFSNTYKRMGITYHAMGNDEEAKKYLALALGIRKMHLKESDPRIKELEEELEKCV